MIAVIGKGHEDYQEIEGVRYPFLDRAVIEEAVKEAAETVNADKRETNAGKGME